MNDPAECLLSVIDAELNLIPIYRCSKDGEICPLSWCGECKLSQPANGGTTSYEDAVHCEAKPGSYLDTALWVSPAGQYQDWTSAYRQDQGAIAFSAIYTSTQVPEPEPNLGGSNSNGNAGQPRQKVQTGSVRNNRIRKWIRWLLRK